MSIALDQIQPCEFYLKKEVVEFFLEHPKQIFNQKEYTYGGLDTIINKVEKGDTTADKEMTLKPVLLETYKKNNFV